MLGLLHIPFGLCVPSVRVFHCLVLPLIDMVFKLIPLHQTFDLPGQLVFHSLLLDVSFFPGVSGKIEEEFSGRMRGLRDDAREKKRWEEKCEYKH